MKVLSLFDGMSCGQIALNRLGVEYDTYYASEIDKWAIQVAKANYPDMIHIGDVTKIQASDFGDEKIDLIMAGSPCQGFSFAGKQLNFDDPRSKLFFEFVRLVKELKPKYFLLENVNMKKEYKDVITEQMGVEPIDINSSLLSGQNRRRLYWTNIPNITMPEDKGINIKDILQGITGIRKRSVTLRDFNKNSLCHHVADAADINGHDSIKRVYGELGKSPTLNAHGGGNTEPKVLQVAEATKKGYTEIKKGDCFDYTFPNSKTRRGRNMKDKSNCLTAANYDYMVLEDVTDTNYQYRKLTPLECERLQTVPDNYTNHVSNTQRYKMLGNGWTVDVICHILKNMEL